MPHSLALDAKTAKAHSGQNGAPRGESGFQDDESTLPQTLLSLDDRRVRRVGIVGFGLSIPRVTSLLEGHVPSQLSYWVGTLWFVTLAATIWHGNRWLLFQQRRHYGWFKHPIRKLFTLIAANVLYTAPVTMAMLMLWFVWTGRPIDGEVLRTVTLINVICVIFVTHAYETVFLIKERESDQLRVARLDRARAEAELEAFLAQVDPHFMFNSLNTLGHLIETDRERAASFNQDLARVYRYLLQQRGHSLVPLPEELRFCSSYLDLMKIRYGSAIHCTLPDPDRLDPEMAIPPTALQLLIENAIKHNEVSESPPLRIELRITDRTVRVQNPRRPRRSSLPRPSAGVGLRNLDERSKLAVDQGIEIRSTAEHFEVRVPLTRLPYAPASVSTESSSRR